MKTAYIILPTAIVLLLIAGCTNVVYSKGEPCSIDACCQNDSYGRTFSCDTQGCVDAIPNWTEPDCNAPASTVTDHVAIQPTHKVEMNILTPDTGHTCSEYFDWMIGVNNYDNTNNAAFDPNLPAIFPVSPVSGAKIVATYMSNGTVISNGTQIADNNGVAILQLNQLATYNISITGSGVQEHSFVLFPADILYTLCLERGSVPPPAPTPAVVIRQIPAVTPVPIAVSTTSDHISKIEDHNPILSLTHTGSVNIITGGWGTGAVIHVNSTNPDLKETVIDVPPDGNAVSLPLEPGNYTATLPDKLDNLSEVHDFYVGNNSITYVAFNGYTYRVSNGAGC